MSSNLQSLSLEKRVLRFIRQNQLILPRKKVLVAVSGGPDSVCLLCILHQLQEELKIQLHIAHLNHGLRGEESDRDARWVIELAQRLDIQAIVEKINVGEYKVQNHLSSEEAARLVRYGFLARTAESTGADLVAVGHTRNDQVETILLHIIRGTGTKGLRGLQPVQILNFDNRRLQVIRPLLEIKREETEDYCKKINIQPCLDSSNLSLSMLRNRVRHELLPLLNIYNPAIAECILRTGSIARDDMAFLESMSLQTWDNVVTRQKNTFLFKKNMFRDLPVALQRQLLRMAIENLLGTLKDIETRHIENILHLINKPAGRQVSLPDGLLFVVEYDRFLLGANEQELIPYPALEGKYDINLPGLTHIPGWTIETSRQSSIKGLSDINLKYQDKFTASFDNDLVGDKLILRSRQTGDTFIPLGMTQVKKVGQFMLDTRIPRQWRDRVPIICNSNQIIWIAGYRIDERVKVTPATKQVLIIQMVQTP